jgi:hypothetical protein
MRPGAFDKRLLALCATVLLSVGTCACGQTGKKSSTSASTAIAESRSTGEEFAPEGTKLDIDGDTDSAHPDEDEHPKRRDRDNDSDSTGKDRYDSDDRSVLDFGHAANAADSRQITALIRRYYAAAAAEDGTKACSMIYSTYAEAIPEDYGTSPPGPAYARGTTCPAVLTLVFKHFHNEIMARLPKLEVSRIRIREHQGVAVLSFPGMSEREIRLSREGRTWKAIALTDSELP